MAWRTHWLPIIGNQLPNYHPIYISSFNQRVVELVTSKRKREPPWMRIIQMRQFQTVKRYVFSVVGNANGTGTVPYNI